MSDDEDLVEELRAQADAVQEDMGDFAARKRAKNQGKKTKSAGKQGAASRPGAPRVVTTRDVMANQKVRETHFSVFPHQPTEENTGKHGGLFIVMHATYNTATENGKMLMGVTALDDRTLELRWHVQDDRFRRLMPTAALPDGSNADLVAQVNNFVGRARQQYGIGYSELDALTDDVLPVQSQQTVHCVVVKTTEPINTDLSSWQGISAPGYKIFSVPYARTIKTVVGEFGTFL